VDRGEEVAGGLIVAGCDGAELLELGEEVLDQVARLIEVPIEGSRRAAVASRRDDHGLAGRREGLDDPLVSVERLVGDQRVGLHVRQEVISADQIMRLAAAQMEAERVAQCIDQGMDLGAQATTRPPDRLVLAGFFWAPALGWWARTMVLSIMAYSLSASLARCSKTRCHTPAWASG
jgi:hypothetical protein